MDYHSDDFSTAREPANDNTIAAWRAADTLGLSGRAARQFTQGFIHARQGRTDLYQTDSTAYDAGYNAA